MIWVAPWNSDNGYFYFGTAIVGGLIFGYLLFFKFLDRK